MEVFFRGFDDDVGAAGEPYSAHSAQLVGGEPLRLAAGFERSVSRGKRTASGDSLVERRHCAAPLLYTWPTSPSARPHLLFIYLFMSSRANPFTLHTTFSTPSHITGNHGGHGRSLSPLLFFFPPPGHLSPAPPLADAYYRQRT